MDILLIGLVALLLSSVVIAFYMDWLGLWVSKDEIEGQSAAARKRVSLASSQGVVRCYEKVQQDANNLTISL